MGHGGRPDIRYAVRVPTPGSSVAHPGMLNTSSRSIAALVAVLIAIVAQAKAAPMILHHGTAADPPSLDPNVAAGTLAAPILTDMFAGLLVRDAESRPAPGSAESWSLSEDGLTYTFCLRANLRW